MELIKKIFKWIVVLIGLLILIVIVFVLYERWEHTIDEEIAFRCEIDFSNTDRSDEKIYLRFIIQSTPASRDRKNYWDGGLIVYRDRSSENEDKHYQYLQELEVEKVDVDNLYLREERFKNQLKVNRETFDVTITYDDGAIFNTKGCNEVDPQEYRDEVSESQDKVKGLNKI